MKTNTLRLVLALAVSAVSANASYTVTFNTANQTTFAKKMTIAFTGYSGTALTDFPVLVKLSPGDINGFSYTDFHLENGGDLRFADSDGNLLPHEIDTWKTTGLSTVWVKVPSLTSSTTITAYYGCDDPPSVSAKDVWDDDYVGVWHLGESALPMKESSETSSNFTQLNGTGIGFASEGAVGGSVDFGETGNSRYLRAPDHDALDGFDKLTIEMWTFQESRPTTLCGMLSKRVGYNNDMSYFIYETGSSSGSFFSIATAANTSQGGGIVVALAGKWCQQTFVYDSTLSSKRMTGFLDGISTGRAYDTPTCSVRAGGGPLYLGNYNVDSRNFNGKIDEVRISKTARTEAWIKASHDTVTDDGFATYEVDGAGEIEYGPLDTTAFAKRMTVSFTGYSGAALTDFPVLVKLSTAIPRFSYEDFCLEGGGDLRFADSNGNLLPHEIDTWNEDGISTVWVKVPTLTAFSTITACYGCANPPGVAAKDVWDSDYVGVWHLGESALPMKESSKTSTNFTQLNGAGIGFASQGIVGGSVNFGASGSSRALIAPDHDAFDGFSQCTFEAWTYIANRPTGSDKNTGFLSKRITYNNQASYYLHDTGTATTFYISSNGTDPSNLSASVKADSDTWTHQAYTFDGETSSNNVGGWKNGVRVGTSSTSLTSVYAGSASLCLGNFSASDSRNFPGKIDELRISKVARSGDWIKATHDTVAKADFAKYDVEYGLLNTNYYAKSINVTFTGYSGAALTDFPVLVKLSTAIDGFSYADFSMANGGDLRFTDADGKLLPHEIDTWDENGVSTAWVKVPSLTATTTIKAYYGCTDTPADVDAKDVWDLGYVGVWHLGESGLPLKESSGVSSDFETSTGTIAYGAGGAVGGSVNIAGGSGSSVVAPDHATLDGFSTFTIEAWTKQSAHKNDAGILGKRKGSFSEGGISYYLYDSSNKTKLCVSQGGWNVETAQTIAPSVSGNWMHQAYSIDMTAASDNARGYLDGTLSGTGSISYDTVYAGTANLVLGNLYAGAEANSFNGQIDEVRISRVARSGDWIKATHDTVMKANFATYEAVGDFEPIVHERILYVNVDAGATNTLNASDVTVYITNIVKTGAGTLVASSIPDYAGGFDIQSGVFQVSNVGDCGSEGAVINVRDGASLLFTGGANTVLNGKTVNLYGAKDANLRGKIQCETTNNQHLGTGFTLNLFADATIYGYNVNFQLWPTAIDLNGHELTLGASGNWYTARIGGQIQDGGALTFSNATFYVENNGAVPQFSADCATTASVKLKANAVVNFKQAVASNGWTLECNGCAIRGNLNRWPTDTSMPVWDGPIVSTGKSSIASYTGGWNVSNTVFNAKGPFAGSGTLSVGPGWLNLHNVTNSFAGAVTITGQLLESTAQQFTPILPGSGGIGLWNGAACFTNASSVTFNNSARLAFMDNTACTVGTNIVFAGGADDMQSISGGVHTARSTIGGFKKTGAGTLVVDSPAQVMGLADIQAGTLKVAYRSDPTAQTQAAMLDPLPVFSSLRFASGADLDLSDNLGIVLGSLEGSPEVTNSGMFGVSGTWKLVDPAGKLEITGQNAGGGQAAGVLCFLPGATFDLADEDAFMTAVTAAGPDGLLVAEANWILNPAQEGMEGAVALPTPVSTIASGWSMAIGNDSNGDPGRGLYLRYTPKALLFWIVSR